MDPRLPMASGPQVPANREDDEMELEELRDELAERGDFTLTEQKRQYQAGRLQPEVDPGLDPALKGELSDAAVPAAHEGRLRVGEDELEDVDEKMPQREKLS